MSEEDDINRRYAMRDKILADKLKGDVDQMDAEQIRDIIANFKRGMKKQNQLTLSELRRFEWLFSDDLKRKLDTKTLTAAEQERYEALSAEFRSKINFYQPITVVDDITGEEAMPPLPPINRRLARTSNEAERQLVEAFNSAHQLDDGNPNGIIAAHQAQATKMVVDMIVANNLKEELHHEQDQYIEMSRRVLNAVHQDQQPKPVQQRVITSEDPDEGFDFDL